MRSVTRVFLVLVITCAAAGAPAQTGDVRRVPLRVQATQWAAVDVDFFYQPRLQQRQLPLVVLSHGFMRSRVHHSGNAAHLARQGFLVAVPEDTNPATLEGIVLQLIDAQRGNGFDQLPRVDPDRVGLAGHSAGGAASIGAAARLQKSGASVRAICLLDGVPWPNTWKLARELRGVEIASFRAEPGACNANGVMGNLMASLALERVDFVVTGSGHCDQENPSDMLCGAVCGGATQAHQRAFRDLMTLFFRQAFDDAPDKRRAYRIAIGRYGAQPRGTDDVTSVARSAAQMKSRNR
jgi:pimeloyl-ACP methyl ester carboxylesterase